MGVTLTFGLETVTLPSPQLGDSLIHKNDSKINRSMNGTLWITKKPTVKLVEWDFKDVKRATTKELEAFLRATRSETITVLDHHAVSYTAKITSPFNSTDDSRGTGCDNPCDGTFRLSLERVT